MDRVRRAVFKRHIKKAHTKNCSPKQKSKFFKQGGKLDYSRYSQVFLLSLAKFLTFHFYVIAKDHYPCVILYVLVFNLRVASHSN